MDELKQSVQLAVHEQKDPLLIYKFESFELFKNLIDGVNKDILSFLFKAEISNESAKNIQEARPRKITKINTSKEEIPNIDELSSRNKAAGNTQTQKIETIVRDKPSPWELRIVIWDCDKFGGKPDIFFTMEFQCSDSDKSDLIM